MMCSTTMSNIEHGVFYFVEPAAHSVRVSRIKVQRPAPCPAVVYRFQLFSLIFGQLRLLDNNKTTLNNLLAEPVPIESLFPKCAETSMTKMGEDISPEELELIKVRLAKQQEQFHEHLIKDFRRKLEKIRSIFEFLTAEEVHEALKLFAYDEDRVLVEFTKQETLAMIRKAVAAKYTAYNSAKEEKLSEEQRAARRHLSERRGQSAEKGYIASNRRKKVYKQEGRLRLDDAVAQLQSATDLAQAMEGWSSARIRAYQALKDKPNTYYYRFNAPGEQQRNGAWTHQEHSIFLKRVSEVGADGNWGIFSMAIPGRVGYQCANYYRKLIENGSISDPNYVIDNKGKAHYVFGTKSREILAQAPPSVSTTSNSNKGKARKRPQKQQESSSEAFDSDAESSSSIDLASDSSLSLSDEVEEEKTIHVDTKLKDFYENPLPGFIDSITRQEVVRPTISPYGHVLSYDTWLKCLCSGDRRNTCPFTNQPLHKRQLVFLTLENLPIYNDIIVKN